MKGGTHHSPFAKLSFPDSKGCSCGLTETVDGEAWIPSHDFPATFRTIKGVFNHSTTASLSNNSIDNIFCFMKDEGARWGVQRCRVNYPHYS